MKLAFAIVVSTVAWVLMTYVFPPDRDNALIYGAVALGTFLVLNQLRKDARFSVVPRGIARRKALLVPTGLSLLVLSLMVFASSVALDVANAPVFGLFLVLFFTGVALLCLRLQLWLFPS